MHPTNSGALQSALQYEQLIAQLYSEVSLPAGGTTWLESLARFFCLDSAMLIVEGAKSRSIRFADGAGSARHSIELPPGNRVRKMWQLDPGGDLPPRQAFAFNNSLLRNDSQLQPFFQTCLRPFNLASLLCINIEGTADSRICIRLARSEHRHEFSDTELGLLEGFSLHLYRASRLSAHPLERDSTREFASDLQSVLDKLSVGAAIFDDSLCLLASNRAASAILRTIPGISLANDKLHAKTSSQAQRFLQYLEEAFQHEEDKPVFRALTLAIDKSPKSIQFVAGEVFTGRRPPGRKLLTVFIGPAHDSPGTDPELLMDLFGLSRSEAVVAANLASGASIDLTAARLCRSRNTVRSHARAIYEKTGVEGQTQLMALILSSPAHFLSRNTGKRIDMLSAPSHYRALS